MRKTILNLVIAAFMAGIAFFVFRPSLTGGYVFDDYDEVSDNSAVKAGFIDAAYKKPFRAITAATYRVDYLIGRGDSKVFHFTNIVLHLCAGLILIAFWRKALIRLEFGERASTLSGFMAGFIFVVHPMNIEPVSYISARGNILAGIFIFAAFWLNLKAFENGFKIIWHILGLAAICAALFCNETAIGGAFAAMIFTGLAAIISENRAPNISKHWRFYAAILAPHVAIISIWIILRFLHRIDLGAVVSGGVGGWSWYSPFWAMGLYGRLALWPIGLSLDHGFGPTTVVGAVLYSILGMFIVLTVLPVLFYLRKNCSKSAALSLFIWVWWAFSLAASVALPLADAVAERRGYIAVGAVACGTSLFIAYLSEKKAGYLKPAATLGCAIAVLFCGISFSQAQVWRDPTALWNNGVKNNPASARTWDWLGKGLLDSGKIRQAKMAFERAVVNAPRLSRPEGDLGVALTMQGDYDGAVLHFDNALRKDPSDWRVYMDYGVMETQRKNYQNAESHLKTALSIKPDHAPLWFNIGNVYKNWGKTADAVAAYRKAISLAPEQLGARTNMAIALADAGDVEAGWKEIADALTINPNYDPALLYGSKIAYQRGETAVSVEYLRRYLAIKPNDYDAWITLSKILAQLGQDAESQQALEKADALRNGGNAP